jgi:hypothetical protein
MKRLGILLCALCAQVGCVSDADRAAWSEALKDARGDNMVMKSDFVGSKGGDGQAVPPRPRD